MTDRIMVIGAGAWGTAIANLLAKNKKEIIYIWSFEKKVADEINSKNRNSLYLPNIILNKKIEAITNFKGIAAKYIFVAVPSHHVYNIVNKYLSHLRPKYKKKLILVLCSKGFDLKRKKLLSDTLRSLCSFSRMAILSGPSFARLLAENKPTAITLASKNIKMSYEIKNLLVNKYFRVYINPDIVGVQVNAALKNILAIAAGITDGLGYEENARAAIICRGLLEIQKVSIALGGKKRTILTLSGIGDILLTCTSTHSRNYSFGVLIGKGKNKTDIINMRNNITEGIKNTKTLHLIKRKFNLDTPLLDSVYKILVRNHNVRKIVNDLLSRPTKIE